MKHIREVIKRIGVCMFCTKLGHVPFSSRPMVTLKVDEDCRLWFLSNAGSHKNEEILRDDRVELLYEDLHNSEFLALHGTAEILADEHKCLELWAPAAGKWFPNGPEDPELTIIVVTPSFSHYWSGTQYKLVAMLTKQTSKMVGSTPGASEEGVAVTLNMQAGTLNHLEG